MRVKFLHFNESLPIQINCLIYHNGLVWCIIQCQHMSVTTYNFPISLSSFIIIFFNHNFQNDLGAHGRYRDMELTSELDNSQLQDQLRRLMVNISLYKHIPVLGYNLHDKFVASRNC
jgi:hypothetical protein